MNTFEAFFRNHDRFEWNDGVYCQRELGSPPFEKEYLQLRAAEGRLYNDEMARLLPKVPQHHAHFREWKLRQRSASILVETIGRERPATMIEVGCGNGWLVRYVQRQLGIQILGVDIGLHELKQAVRVDEGKNTFAQVDILSGALDGLKVDMVLLAASIQYFADIDAVMAVLMKTVRAGGSIHIIDSPFYSATSVLGAKTRSDSYFESYHASGMNGRYFHHQLEQLGRYNFEIVYDPKRPWSRLKKRLGLASPLYWVKVRL